MKIINWLSQIFKDEKGSTSSKRVVGIMCAIFLCVALYRTTMHEIEHNISDNLVDNVTMLAFGCLGLTAIDKAVKHIGDKFGKNTNDTSDK